MKPYQDPQQPSSESPSFFKIRGKWRSGGKWESSESWPTENEARAMMKRWQEKMDAGEWAESTQYVVEIIPPIATITAPETPSGDCGAMPCSRSSDTPETDDMASMRRATSEWVELCGKLERERNEARRSEVSETRWAKQYFDERNALLDAIRNLRDVSGRHNSQIACERLFALLPEND